MTLENERFWSSDKEAARIHIFERTRFPCKKILRSNSDLIFLGFGTKGFLGSAGAIYRGGGIKKKAI